MILKIYQKEEKTNDNKRKNENVLNFTSYISSDIKSFIFFLGGGRSSPQNPSFVQSVQFYFYAVIAREPLYMKVRIHESFKLIFNGKVQIPENYLTTLQCQSDLKYIKQEGIEIFSTKNLRPFKFQKHDKFSIENCESIKIFTKVDYK